jgi:hypothetical protein
MGITSHRLPSGGALPGGLPPSGDRWLRATGGYGRLVATGDGRRVAIRCQAVGRCQEGFHRLATGGYGRLVATGDRW